MMGETILRTKAFSKNFHAIGKLFSQQMWDTKKLANSKEGKDTPDELRHEETWTAHTNGSPPFSCSTLVISKTLSQRFPSSDTSIMSSLFALQQIKRFWDFLETLLRGRFWHGYR